ncbi:MAG TPA: polysaccharide deacetylase family protein [Vicinamibacterales bacterium]|nr:polysaccharide deacetylase family protein [Vicinamibacterales bacterium]
MLFVLLALWQLSSPPPSRTMAVTIDDLPTSSVLGENFERAERTTTDLLAAIRRTGVPAIGFVNERKLQPAGKVHPRHVGLLQQWLDAGLELGNHSFSHDDLHLTDVKAFIADVIRGEEVTRRLLAATGQRPRYFRHPFLHTGRSLEVKKAFEAFLKDRGYTVAPVTVDNYDYIFAAAYDRTLASGDAAQTKRVVETYVDYMEAVVAYYEQQSVAIVGREISQTLLLHANALNAATLDRLVARLRKRGYRFVTLDQALKDPAYGSLDEYVGPAGMTWLHRWALTAGKRGIFAGEPEVPAWVRKAARM